MNTGKNKEVILRAKGVYKQYGDIEVLSNVDIEVRESELVAIVGASGAGKSTLLHILATLLESDRGEIYLSGKPLHTLSEKAVSHLRNKEMGFVFQFHHLLEELTVKENIALPAFIAKRKGYTIAGEVKKWISRLGLEGKENHKPSMLSGGEAQRVAMARALINHPKIVYADEPSGNLDSKNAQDLHALLEELSQKEGHTFVIATHNQDFVRHADRRYVMQDGKLLAKHSP